MFLFRGECRPFRCNWNEEENKVDPTKADVCFCFITSFVKLAMTKTKWLQSAERWVNYSSLRKAEGHWVTSIHQSYIRPSIHHFFCISASTHTPTRTKSRSKEKKFVINRKLIIGVCLFFYITHLTISVILVQNESWNYTHKKFRFTFHETVHKSWTDTHTEQLHVHSMKPFSIACVVQQELLALSTIPSSFSIPG